MKIKGLIEEDFANYKKPSMTVMFPYCTFKCGTEYCQNTALAEAPIIDISVNELVKRYLYNPLTESIVIQGLEPFDSWDDLKEFVQRIREYTNDDIVIYTGYNRDEIEDKISALRKYRNIIVKFGRFLCNDKYVYDRTLGVTLASSNQYAERIS